MDDLVDKRFESLRVAIDLWLEQIEDDLWNGKTILQLKEMLCFQFSILNCMKQLLNCSDSSLAAAHKILDDLQITRLLSMGSMAQAEIEGFLGFMSSAERTWLEVIDLLRSGLMSEERVLLLHAMYSRDEDEAVMDEITIRRSHILDDSRIQFSTLTNKHFRSKLNIKFRSEIAIGFGVAKEWLLLISEKLFSKDLLLFQHCGAEQRVRLIPLGDEESAKGYLRLAGIVISLAFKYRIRIGVRLHRVFFKLLQHGKTKRVLLPDGRHSLVPMFSLEDDMKDADEDLYNGYKKLLTMDSEEIAMVDDFLFVAEDGTPLCEGGDEIKLTIENRERFIQLRIDDKFFWSVEEEFDWFHSGLRSVLEDDSADCWGLFMCSCLEDIDNLLGEGYRLSIEDWMSNIIYEGYNEFDVEIIWFWEILEAMTMDERRNFLFFWTAIRFLPVEGFRGLSTKPKLVKSRDNTKLPTSHTCDSILVMPPYESKEVMKNKMSIITSIAYENFGFI